MTTSTHISDEANKDLDNLAKELGITKKEVVDRLILEHKEKDREVEIIPASKTVDTPKLDQECYLHLNAVTEVYTWADGWHLELVKPQKIAKCEPKIARPSLDLPDRRICSMCKVGMYYMTLAAKDVVRERERVRAFFRENPDARRSLEESKEATVQSLGEMV